MSQTSALQLLQELQITAYRELGSLPGIEAELLQNLDKGFRNISPIEANQRAQQDLNDFLEVLDKWVQPITSGKNLSPDVEQFVDTMKRMMSNDLKDASRDSMEFFYKTVDKSAWKTLKDKLPSSSMWKTFLETPLPTPFEHPEHYRRMLALKPLVDTGLNNLNFQITPSPLLGTLPHGEVNAKVFFVSETQEYLITFNSGFFGYIERAIAIIFQYTLPHTESTSDVMGMEINKYKILAKIAEFFVPHEKHKIDAMAKLFQLLIHYLVEGNPFATPDYFSSLSRAHQFYLMTKIQFASAFALSHEFGHIVNGHFSSDKISKAFIGNNSVDVFKTSWQQEIQADIRGYQITLGASNAKGIGHILSASEGVDLFFSLINILERARSLLMFGNEFQRISISHPPASVRRDVLRKVIEASLPKEESQAILKMGKSYQSIIEEMWQYIRPNLLTLHHKGTFPAAMWKDLLIKTID